MRNSLRRILILTKRNLKEIVRDPISLVFLIGLPLIMEIMFYLIFHTMTSQFEMKYLAPGIVAFSQSFLTLFSGMLIAVDRNSSFLTRLYVSRAKSHEFIFGYAFAMLPITLVQSVLFFLVGGIIEPSIFCVGMILAVLLSLVTALLFIGLGILFGSVCTERSIGGVASIIISGQSLLSGMWFPLDSMGAGILTVMRCLPFRNAALLLQNTINGVGDAFNDFALPLIIVLAYTAVAFIAAILVFKSKMKEK